MLLQKKSENLWIYLFIHTALMHLMFPKIWPPAPDLLKLTLATSSRLMEANISHHSVPLLYCVYKFFKQPLLQENMNKC